LNGLGASSSMMQLPPAMLQEKSSDVGRRLISLSRQGGISLKDRYGKQEANRNGKPVAKKLGKSESAPTLMGTKSSTKGGTMTGSSRLGGGWARNEMSADLRQYRELLADVAEWNLSLDFCEEPYYRTALWEATWKNHESIVKLLAAKGANIAAPDYQGRTPLHEAAYYGHANLVDFFIDKGHPMDCVDSFGQTPLFRASEAGRSEVVRLLIERGANANLLDNHNVSAQHVSAFQGRLRLAEYLRFKGAFRNRCAIGEETEKARRESSSGAIKSGAALLLTPSSRFPQMVHP